MKKKLLLVMLGITLAFSAATKTYAWEVGYGGCSDWGISAQDLYDTGSSIAQIEDALNKGAWATNPEMEKDAKNFINQHSGESAANTEQQPAQENENTTATADTKNVTTAETVTEAETATHEHNFIETVTKEPTCTELGEKTFTCECGETYTEPIAMIEHVPGEWEEETAATCTTEGKDVQKCTVCGNVIAERTTTLTHLAGEWEVTKPATMISKGTEVKKCVDCGKELETREIPVLMYPWFIIGGVVVLGGALTTVIVVKRKKD